MTYYIQPNWPAPANVKAYTTTRKDGYSVGTYAAFNLAAHVGDDIIAVTKNRQKLCADLKLPGEPCWLQQQHTTRVVDLAHTEIAQVATFPADAAYTAQLQQVCVVLTADCLPVLLCNKQGSVVAAVHAGWRGLADGIIAATVSGMRVDPKQLLAWFGPAIGPKAFVVGNDVYQAFVASDVKASEAFTNYASEAWLMDIYLLARQQLLNCGVTAIYGGEFCTYNDAECFFSYRRDNKITGRMASLIWLD